MLRCVTGREGRSKTCPEQIGALIASAWDMARRTAGQGARSESHGGGAWLGGWREGTYSMRILCAMAHTRITAVSPLRGVVQSVRVCQPVLSTITGTTRRYLAVAPVTVVCTNRCVAAALGFVWLWGGPSRSVRIWGGLPQ